MVQGERRVVVDGNLVTSPGGLASYEASLYVVEQLFGKDQAMTIASALVSGPSNVEAAVTRRHTFVTNARRANIDYFRLMAVTGHKTLRLFQRYNLIEEVDLQEAMTSSQTYLAHRDMDTSLDTSPDDRSATRRKDLVNPRG
jgi:hypothetical protein